MDSSKEEIRENCQKHYENMKTEDVVDIAKKVKKAKMKLYNMDTS